MFSYNLLEYQGALTSIVDDKPQGIIFTSEILPQGPLLWNMLIAIDIIHRIYHPEGVIPTNRIPLRKGKRKFLILENGRGHKGCQHVTVSPIKRQVTNAEVTKIELELKEAPDNMEDQLPDVLIGSVPTKLNPTPEINSTNSDGSGGVVVRAEEALIVVLVLVLWVAAIALFFNRWGKIRMLEPYQPKFQQQHRPSCAISDPSQLPHRACSKFNIHCLDHPVHQNSLTSALSRPRQNSVFVGSSMSLLPCENAPRRAKSAFDLQSLVMAEYAVQVPIEDEPPKPLKSLEIPKPSFQRQRGMSICHFDRMDVLARPLQRERGMSICHFDRTDVLARPLQRERGMSICHFDRTDVLARPVQRERGMSICHFDRSRTQRESSARPGVAANFDKSFQKESRLNVSNFEKPEAQSRSLQRNERGIGICHFDRATTSSKSPEVSHNYKATCV